MLRTRLSKSTIVLAILCSCGNPAPEHQRQEMKTNTSSIHQTNEEPKIQLKNLSSLKETVFIPTLEHGITRDKNYIYSASLLFAWNDIQKVWNKESIQIAPEFKDLRLINNSKSYFLCNRRFEDWILVRNTEQKRNRKD